MFFIKFLKSFPFLNIFDGTSLKCNIGQFYLRAGESRKCDFILHSLVEHCHNIWNKIVRAQGLLYCKGIVHTQLLTLEEFPNPKDQFELPRLGLIHDGYLSRALTSGKIYVRTDMRDLN